MVYEVMAPNLQGSIVLTYDANGILELADFGKLHALDSETLKFFATHFPMHQAWLARTVEQINGTAKLVQLDITFELFYTKYGHKEGKIKAEAAWNKLKPKEKAAAYNYIPRYNSILAANQWRGKLMPATYLNQKRWLD